MRAKTIMKGTLDALLISLVALNLAILTGCGSSGGSSAGGGGGGGGAPLPGALAAGGAADIYVIQHGPSGTGDTILDFAVDSSQSAAPKGTLTVPAAAVALSVATDSAGQIYAGLDLYNGDTEEPTEEIVVYAAGATGSATPLRTIVLEGEGVSMVYPGSLTVDSTGVIYTAGPSGNVAVIAAGANGTTTPTRLLTSGDLTGPVGLAVDAAGEIFVTNETLEGPDDDYVGGTILVFAAGANGTDAPVRVISAPAPTATTDVSYYGIAVDGAGNIYTVLDTVTYDSAGYATGTSAVLQVYAAGATGTPTPTKTVSGAATDLSFGGGLRMDKVGNIYLVNAAGTTTETFSVLGFGPNATGNIAPGLNIASSSWTDAAGEIAVQ